MENENDSELDDKNISNSECAFQLDYSNQSLKENKKFQKWKIQMLKKYGNDAKLFKCKNDNCYFYGSNKECKTKPLGAAYCPICRRSICYYCLSISYDDSLDCGKCCVKRRVYCMLFQDGYSFIKPESYDDPDAYYSFLKIFFIPIVSFMNFVAYFSATYFYKLDMKSEDGGTCESIFYKDDNHGRLFMTEIVVNVGIAFALSIPFLIIDIYFKILLLIISLPFKNYPLKYYFGILYQGLREI